MKLALIGGTGMVGRTMLKILEERNFPIKEIVVVGSEKSIGKHTHFKNKPYNVIGLEEALSFSPNLALFSAGSEISKTWAPKFSNIGCTVIDNSSEWRMSPGCKLIVPEINANKLSEEDKIIANPNCSTIQLVMVLYPLHIKFKIKRVVVSTYQSVSGTGMAALSQLNNEENNTKGKMIYPYQIHRNCLPHCDVFNENGYTKEELKLLNETRKILNDGNINLTATAVRVPVESGHSESVNIEFFNKISVREIKNVLDNSKGIFLQDNIKSNIYPMPIYAKGKDEVFVGRVRKDESQPNSINMWVVADNLRKGAATNAIQIAEYLVSKKWV